MSNAERQKRYRDSKRNAPEPETVTRVTPEPDRNAPTLIPGVTVYGRRAVWYPGDVFETRPEPWDRTDQPDPLNRCIYQRQDGTRYLLDATGNVHERPVEQEATA